MIIKAIQFRKDGYYSAPFVFGGEEGMDKYDIHERYRGSLQNYLIDTGKEVILVDTGLPKGTPEESPDENTPLFTGHDAIDYMDGLKALGYQPEQVSKIILTPVVTFIKRSFLKTVVPIITAASPITIVPVPEEMSNCIARWQ